MITRRLRFPRPPRVAEPITAEPPHVVQDDFGRWSLGWGDDAPGNYPTRKFARDEWLARQTRHSSKWLSN
jgi:hypothetical protein